MDEMLKIIGSIAAEAPEVALIVMAFVAWVKFGRMQKKDGQSYVKREDCHKHIDMLKDKISHVEDHINETKIDIREIRKKLFDG